MLEQMDVDFQNMFEKLIPRQNRERQLTVKEARRVLLEQEYYSVGGGFIEWKDYQPPQKNPPKYPYSTMKEVLDYTARDNISIAELAYANELAISGRDKATIDAFLDKIIGAMRATVNTGLNAPSATLPGPIKLKTKAGDVYQNALKEEYPARRGIGRPRSTLFWGGARTSRGSSISMGGCASTGAFAAKSARLMAMTW